MDLNPNFQSKPSQNPLRSHNKKSNKKRNSNNTNSTNSSNTIPNNVNQINQINNQNDPKSFPLNNQNINNPYVKEFSFWEDKRNSAIKNNFPNQQNQINNSNNNKISSVNNEINQKNTYHFDKPFEENFDKPFLNNNKNNMINNNLHIKNKIGEEIEGYNFYDNADAPAPFDIDSLQKKDNNDVLQAINIIEQSDNFRKEMEENKKSIKQKKTIFERLFSHFNCGNPEDKEDK